MYDIWRRLGLLLVGLFTLAVAVTAVYVVTTYPKAPAAALLTATTVPTATPTATPTDIPTVAPTATASPTITDVLLVGPNLARLRLPLATATGGAVRLAEAGNPAVIAAGALERAVAEPGVVVLEVRPGATTSVRTAAAITAVQARWPGVRIVVVGPFSKQDRKSATAVQTAAALAKVEFLDPVALAWRTDATSATVSLADAAEVAGKLAAAL